MLVYAGIDEAGYGPMLGPLCVAATVFVLEDHDPAEGPPALWRLLKTAVCRKPSDRRRRVAVDDSKKLKGARDGAGHPLRHLERGVMSFLPGDLAGIGTDADLFDRISLGVPPRPWFESVSSLPLAHTTDELRIARGRVRRCLDRAKVRCETISCTAIDAAQLNRDAAETGTKAAVNFRAATRLLERIWRAWPGTHPRVVIDRHGGRTRYAEALARGLGDAAVEVVAETPSLSRYTLTRGGARCTVSFALEGDARFLPVSLASMTAKLARELLMLRLNRFFRGHLPRLAPTAGYFGDARRYVAEIKPVMRRLRLPAAELVRNV